MIRKCQIPSELASCAWTQELNSIRQKIKSRMADEVAAECLFERLRHHQLRAPEATEVARAITLRINSRLLSQDKHVRQNTLEKLWNPQSGALQILLTVLENSRDHATSTYIASIFREVFCLKQGKGKKSAVPKEIAEIKKKPLKPQGKENKTPTTKKACNKAREDSTKHLITLNGCQIIIKTLWLTFSKRDGNVSNEIMVQDLVWILAAIATKDPRFANKMRLLGCVRTIHMIMKGHYSNNKIIFPLLVIMKQLAKNSSTSAILIKDGVIMTYERVLVTLGFIPTARLRLCLDAIDYFSKNKVCCMQIVKSGLSNVLIRVFDRWDRYEGRMRLKICAHILQTLQHLCNIKSGRRALCTKKNVQKLHRFCSQCPDEPEFDGLLARVCSVITLCLKHQALPVAASSPATFNLTPIIKDSNISWPCLDEDDTVNSDIKSINTDSGDETPDLYVETEFDNLDMDFFDDSSNKDKKSKEKEVKTKCSDLSQSSSWNNPNERDPEDLKKYNIFFKEYGSSKQLKLNRSRSNSRGSILDDYLMKSSGYRSGVNPILTVDRNPSPTFSLNGSSKLQGNTSSCSSLKLYKEISRFTSASNVYYSIASKVKSVIQFVKVAYPDLRGGESLNHPEPLNVMERTTCRSKLLSCVDRAINPESYMNEVVYDLDALCSNETLPCPKSCCPEPPLLTNTDEQEILKVYYPTSKLSFESRFESGNLRKAVQIGLREYELILMPDVNSTKRHQWFYFEVKHMMQGRPYIFNIVNCEKSESQFNFGMKPVLYSVKEATLGRPGWVRAGTDICYYRNSYHYSAQKHNKCYLTVTFTIEFPHSNDVCYLAYHFPYTYSMMMTRIWQWSLNISPDVYLRVEPLCYSLKGNEVPVITITADEATNPAISEREVIFLTARVHPGESNASWVMDGTLNYLLGDTSTVSELRKKYVFKIVPMLNIDGVINGCHRCGLTNEDLNRRWSKPNPVLHPSIYHTKGLIEYLTSIKKKPPLVYCDYHGHSRKKNVFFYGCSAAESWCTADRQTVDEPVKYLMLPALMHRLSPAFALGSCSFKVERERESTARVTVWRHLGVTRSYTMEASFCGFDRGPFKGFHLNTQHLQNVGSDFCDALNGLGENVTNVDIDLTRDTYGELVASSEGGSGSDSVLKTDSDEDFD